MKRIYDSVIPERIDTKTFPKVDYKTCSLDPYFYFPHNVSIEDIERAYEQYDVRHTYRYLTDAGYGIALLYKSPDGKIREVKEIGIGPLYEPNELPKIAVNRIRRIKSAYKKGSYPQKQFSGKELMGEEIFNPLPCPFGLHRVFESKTPIIKVLDEDLDVLAMTAFDSYSTYISANEEQLSGELAKNALKNKKVFYFSSYTNYKDALEMGERLREQGIDITISSFIRDIPSPQSYYNIRGFVITRASKGWKKADIMKEIKALEPSF